MGKRKRAEKRARKQARGTEAEAAFHARDEALGRRRRLRTVLLIAWPVVVGLGALGSYLADRPQIAGMLLLGGAVVWFPLWLGSLGRGVSPRDRDRAGGIDFGTRR